MNRNPDLASDQKLVLEIHRLVEADKPFEACELLHGYIANEVYPFQQDKARLDWIGAEEAEVDRIDRVQSYWFEGVGLRDAIDSAMKE